MKVYAWYIVVVNLTACIVMMRALFFRMLRNLDLIPSSVYYLLFSTFGPVVMLLLIPGTEKHGASPRPWLILVPPLVPSSILLTLKQVQFSALSFSATSFSPITEVPTNTDVPLVVGPPASDASGSEIGMFVLLLGVLLIGTCGCLWAMLSLCRWAGPGSVIVGGFVSTHRYSPVVIQHVFFFL